MTGTIKKYTKNLKMKIPVFNIATWHDAMDYDFTLIDSLLGNFFNTQKFKGEWKAVTEYHVDDIVYIVEEGSQYDGMIMKILVDHVTDDLTFSEFYELNPSYYERLFEIEQISEYIRRAREWASKTDGKVEIDGVEVDYSSKAYATGGTGTETNNAKYFKNLAQTAATNADSSANAASTSATNAHNSEVAAYNAQVEATHQKDLAVENATDAIQAKVDATYAKLAAQSSATTAENAASSANDSATTATNAATTATTQAGIATTQATNAASSASSASTSATNAHTSETNAATSATNAETSATNASNSATDASNSATTAAEKATDSETSATSSANSADLSKQWAVGEPSEPEGGSAKYWAGQASQGQIQSDWTQTDDTQKDFIKNKPNIINNTSSDSIIDVLSAAVGKVLQEQINNLQGRGKYLSIWDCTTGLAMDEPPVNPYIYETGSFFIVGKVASVGETNYKPNGATYDKDVPSTTIETGSIKVNDTYYYDGTVWCLLDVPEVTVAFNTLAGSPYDNTNLSNALNSKATAAQGAKADTALQPSDLNPYRTSSAQDVIDNTKANTDLSNLSATGNGKFNAKQDVATALNYNNISNCITHIPQDIKLELNNGTLTLKAGSKVYVPNGAGLFDVVTTLTDLNATVSGNLEWFCFLKPDGSEVVARGVSSCYSGTSDPGTAGTAYYLTDSNILHYRYANGTQINASFPFCKITTTNGVVTSIDQVFNGFGYIGSTVFALPGIKGLIPNGRNSDGSLKNIEYTISSVKTSSRNLTSTNVPVWLRDNGNIEFSSGISYDEKTNTILNTAARYAQIATVDMASGVLSNFIAKNTFHALDYNDKLTIVGWGMPSGNYIDVTLGASGSQYTAPANGYFVSRQQYDSGWYTVYCSLGTVTQTTSSNLQLTFIIPVKRGEKIGYNYSNIRTTLADRYFRFYYTEGDNV